MRVLSYVATLALAATYVTATALQPQVRMPPLPRAVADDLASRHPSEYTVYDPFSNVTDTGDLEKRAPPSNLYGIQTRCTRSRCLSYSFDDGPYDYMYDIVNQAEREGLRGKLTFFVNVMNWDCIYNSNRVAAIRYAYERGHQICSHTATHVNLNTVSYREMDRQVELVETALHKIIGAVPSCIRPPYGALSPERVGYLNDRHSLVVVNWNYDSGDTAGISVESQRNRLRQIRSPRHAIVLMHDVVRSTAYQLWPSAFSIARQNGYTPNNVYTVPEGLRFYGYKSVTGYGRRDSSWNCNGMRPGR